MRNRFQPMGFVPPTYSYTTPQEPDTLSLSGAIPAVIPQKEQGLKLKVERPVIKSFDFERDDDVPRKFQEAVAKSASPVVVQETVVVKSPKGTPDINEYLQLGYADGQYFPGLLYPVPVNDSVSLLTYANYYGKMGAEGELHKSETSVASSVPDDSNEIAAIGSPGDSLSNESESITWIENAVVKESESLKPFITDKPLVQQEWFLSIVILSVAITGILRLKWRNYLGGVFSAVLFSGVASSLRADKPDIPGAASFWLGFLFYLNFSLFIFEALFFKNRSPLGFTGWKLLGLIFVFLFFLFTAKILAHRFIGWVFEVREKVNAHLFQSSLMSKAYSLVLLPLIVLFPFANNILQPWLLGTGVGVFILLYVIQIGHGIGNNLRDTLSGYYIILYLCALEILPLSILFKVFFY